MSRLKIRIMAVREDHCRRGCKYGFLDTMGYQSPEFYRQHGYQVVGAIPDWDSHGHTKFYFTKQTET